MGLGGRKGSCTDNCDGEGEVDEGVQCSDRTALPKESEVVGARCWP